MAANWWLFFHQTALLDSAAGRSECLLELVLVECPVGVLERVYEPGRVHLTLVWCLSIFHLLAGKNVGRGDMGSLS